MSGLSVIVPAAGTGVRFGGDKKKQFYELGGVPVLVHTIKNLSASNEINEIIVVSHLDEIDYCKKIVEEYGLAKVSDIIAGGATRQESVAKGLELVSKDVGYVLVHDGVRPFVTEDMVSAVIKSAMTNGAAIAGANVSDTLKQVKDGVVIKTVARDNVIRSQTPQCFRYDILRAAIKKARLDDFQGTDEASLVERIGLDVHIVEGSPANIKITTPDDLAVATALLKIFDR